MSETQEELQKRAKSENFHHNGWVLAHKYQSDHQFVEFNPHLDNRMLFYIFIKLGRDRGRGLRKPVRNASGLHALTSCGYVWSKSIDGNDKRV